MKRTLTALGVLAPLALGGCDPGPQTASRTEAAIAAPDAQAPRAVPKQAVPRDHVTTDPGQVVQRASVAQTPAQARKALDANRGLMNQALAYMDQNRFDLAEQNLRELKAKRDTLPEFMQVQVDRLDALIKTGAVSEPRRSLKAAIMESEAQESRR
jgi:hypothetical protein